MRELTDELMAVEIEREQQKKAAVQVLGQAGISLMNENRIIATDLYSDQRDHDVHAFFRSRSNPQKVIHLQVYSGFSSGDNLCVATREMDYQKLAEVRSNMHRLGGPSIGNEVAAVTRRVMEQTFIPNSPDAVEDLLKVEFPEVPFMLDGISLRES